MKILSALFFGMGIGYMNQGDLLFLIPMGVGMFFYITDYILELKSSYNKPIAKETK